MSAFVRSIAVLGLGLSAGACSSFGPQEIYNRAGLVPDPVAMSSLEPATTVYSIFRQRVLKALQSNAPADLAAMHQSGFNLVKMNCAAFYRRMGVNERRSRVARNLISPISTVLNGILALHDWSNHTNRKEDILQIITLGTAAGATALDVYDENFLFKSSNIDSVRTMTMNELNNNKVTDLSTLPDVTDVIAVLMEYQNMCTPSHIVVRARDKIQDSSEPANSSPITAQ